MNSVNFQASVTNLAQTDRIQHDSHRTPVVQQQQNADISRNEAARRIDMPTEADRADGKTIDPEAKREERERRRKRRPKPPDEEKQSHAKRGESGHIIDLTA